MNLLRRLAIFDGHDMSQRSLRAWLDLPSLCAVAVTLAFACCPLTSGYFDLTAWAPLLIAVIAVLAGLWAAIRPQLTRSGAVALSGLLTLLALSAISLLWAQSKQNAWTDTNRVALYAVVFVLALTVIRSRQTARLVMMLLGLAALLSVVVLAVEFLFGTGTGAFLSRRLDSPIGYVNGTAGLLAMGIWPWLALSESAESRLARALAQSAATAIAATAVLTQSRAVLPALAISIVITLAAEPRRSRRGVIMLLMFLGVGLALPWVLHVYTQGGFADHDLAPTHAALRGAGAAILVTAVTVGLLRFVGSLRWSRMSPNRQSTNERRVGVALAGTVIVAIFFALIVGWSSIEHQYRAFTSDQDTSQTSVRFLEASGPRFDLWRVALKEFEDHPLGGLGAGNYDTDYYRLRTTTAYVQNPHSIELQMLAELGILGLLALLAFCGGILWSGLRKQETLASTDPLIKIAALGVFTTWLVETSGDWLYDIPGLTGMALIAAAVLLLPQPVGESINLTDLAVRNADTSRKAVPVSWRRRWSRPVITVLPLTLMAVMAVSVGREYAGQLYSDAGSKLIVSAPNRALAKLRNAYRSNPDNLQTLYWIADSYQQLGDESDEQAVLRVAQAREPSNYVPPALLAELAVKRQQPKLARSYFDRSLRLNPLDPAVEGQLTSRLNARKR